MTNSFGLFSSSIMGMSAQAAALANISENISNSGSTAYKHATTHFLTMLNGFQDPNQFGGGVYTKSRYDIAQQGPLNPTGNFGHHRLRPARRFVEIADTVITPGCRDPPRRAAPLHGTYLPISESACTMRGSFRGSVADDEMTMVNPSGAMFSTMTVGTS